MKSEIKKFFRGEVEEEEETLVKYSHDASLLEVRPKVVVFPKDAEDVKRLVKWVGENKDKYQDQERNKNWANLSITARCAGTDMSGGAIGESIIMDFTRHMNRLISFAEPDASAQDFLLRNVNHSQKHTGLASITVQPGMFYRDFEKITLEKGLILPCFTASKSINALGGMFGNNSAGEKTLKYGTTQDYVLEAKVVFTDGVEHTIKSFPLSEISNQDEIQKKVYELIRQNEEEINHAKPKVHKNSAG